MLGQHDSIAIGPDSAYAKEMRKWESEHTRYGKPGRPYPYKPGDEGYEFPRRLYKAVRRTDGPGIEYEGFTVNNEDESRNMQSRGYCLSQPLALEALEAEQLEHGKLAAERNYEVAYGRISEKAAAEVRAAEAAYGARHLPMVPETPVKRKPGRPRKVVEPSGA